MGLELVGGGIDRTAKMYTGGRQVRPDGGYSRGVAPQAAFDTVLDRLVVHYSLAGCVGRAVRVPRKTSGTAIA